MTKQEFMEALLVYKACGGQRLEGEEGKMKMKVWYEILHQMPIQEFRAAVLRFVKEDTEVAKRNFPAEIRAYSALNRKDRRMAGRFQKALPEHPLKDEKSQERALKFIKKALGKIGGGFNPKIPNSPGER